MGITRTDEWKCDLCGALARVAHGMKPEGWAKVTIENRYVDRDFSDKCLCSSCFSEVVHAAKANGERDDI